MKNIIDYVETEMQSFDEAPFSPLDSLVLSQFSYIHFDNLAPTDRDPALPFYICDALRAEFFDSMLTNTRDPSENKQLLLALAASPRFREIEMCYYISEFDATEGKQFSAVCFVLDKGLNYLAFRGTDDTIVGWKEDFSMAFKNPVPSQQRAAEYFLTVSEKLNGRLMLGGHSKGGNLAVYAAMTAPPLLQNRILQVYDHDGPGFKDGVLDCEGYRRIKEKIQKTIPESSLVGMLLDGHESYSVIESSRIGFMQHDPFSWKISNGHFITTEHVSDGALYINRSLRDWLDSLSDEERERFVEVLFNVLDAGNAQTFAEITHEWRKNLAAIFTAMKDTDPEMKQFMRQLLKEFGVKLMRNIRAHRAPELPPGISQDSHPDKSYSASVPTR